MTCTSDGGDDRGDSDGGDYIISARIAFLAAGVGNISGCSFEDHTVNTTVLNVSGPEIA